MLGVLVWKELLEHLRSLRFAVSFVTIVGLFVVGAAVWNLRIDDERKGHRLGVEEYEEAIESAAPQSLTRLLFTNPNLWLPSSGLTFASGGYSRGLPNVASIIWRWTLVDGFERRGDPNPMLFRLDPDWVFIAGMLGTLMALLLTYDGVAGEKERGCLRQLLANRVPRDQVLIAKYLAGLAMAAAAILTGVVASVAIIQLLGEGLPGEGWPALVGVVIAALLCVSVFLWLGLWTSSRTHNSALALLAGLVSWAVLAVFLPQAGVLAGEYLVEVPSHTEAARRASFDTGPGPAAEEGRREAAQALRHYWTLLVHQVDVARKATLVSPVSALSLASEALTVTGVARYSAFVEQAHEHRREFADFLQAKDAQDPDSEYVVGAWGSFSKKPVPPEEVPPLPVSPPLPARTPRRGPGTPAGPSPRQRRLLPRRLLLLPAVRRPLTPPTSWTTEPLHGSFWHVAIPHIFRSQPCPRRPAATPS